MGKTANPARLSPGPIVTRRVVIGGGHRRWSSGVAVAAGQEADDDRRQTRHDHDTDLVIGPGPIIITVIISIIGKTA